MKRKILIFLGAVLVFLILIFIYAFITSFKVIKQDTDEINLVYKENFRKIVRIPEEYPPSLRSMDATAYTWEMVTREKEVVTVRFIHETDFLQKKDKLTSVLEMVPGNDPSIFDKVTPAVVADDQVLESIYNPEDKNLGPNEIIGYNQIELFSDEEKGKVVKIVWEFDKDKISQGTEKYQENLNKYPEPILKFLYRLQRSVLILLAP